MSSCYVQAQEDKPPFEEWRCVQKFGGKGVVELVRITDTSGLIEQLRSSIEDVAVVEWFVAAMSDGIPGISEFGLGSVSTTGITHWGFFGVAGLDRTWMFGPDSSLADKFKYSFTINPGGLGTYSDTKCYGGTCVDFPRETFDCTLH